MIKKIILYSLFLGAGISVYYSFKDAAQEALGAWLFEITKQEFFDSIKTSLKAFTSRSRLRFQERKNRRAGLSS